MSLLHISSGYTASAIEEAISTTTSLAIDPNKDKAPSSRDNKG